MRSPALKFTKLNGGSSDLLKGKELGCMERQGDVLSECRSEVEMSFFSSTGVT